MTIEKQYESRVRMIALRMEEDMNFTHVILDDISTKYEKQVLKKLIHRYSRSVEENEMFGFDNTQNERIIRVLKGRQSKVIEQSK